MMPFNSVIYKGNPAGVALSDEVLDDKQMQERSKKVGFNKTAFVV